ncbi:MAG: DapH/DapD/GlmU-related protein [Paludibacter sp.]|nr:DapH/DapD/GlmU-related protein [Paludibacter sp.]
MVVKNISKIETRAVILKKGCFIGANSIIQKGCIIGENSIVGAGSVVTKVIPDNEVWAGNPAQFIRNLSID